ncbi:MAG TPA: thiamine-phosphate kinase [Candidatus Omnitrophica bacterium]|nr:thiamine-phosphate kinase [Candidatus Omnitrophota bacterium]
MKLKGLDEFELIKRLTSGLKKDSSIIKGVGDDAAIIKYKKDKYIILTTDILIEDVHFKIKEAEPELIGHKSLACNISDIAATGGFPKYALVSLGLPKRLDFDFVNSIYKGIKKTANRYNIKIVGGDTSSSKKLIINIALLGFVDKGNITLRSGAKIGDRIFVSGYLGGAYKKKHFSFKPRLKEALYLVENYKINSMIDLSDGLASDLNQILKASKVGALIYEDKIPLSKEAKDINSALYDGEDFELLFTVDKDEARRIERISSKIIKLTELGQIVGRDKGFKMLTHKKRMKEVSLKFTFRHF